MTRPNINKMAQTIKAFKEIQEDHARKKAKIQDKYTQVYRQLKKREKPPKEFEGSSYLFMRSSETDNSSRPFLEPVFYLSPDLKVAPANDPTGYTRDLITGHRYTITATVRNLGDLNVPSAKLELFLCTPSLGFDTRFADLLGINTLWVRPKSAQQSSLSHTFMATQSGHKCLFARVFSFSPQDIPIDPYKLDPRIDRHVAQLNLNIVNQGTTYIFQSIHLPNFMDTIMLKPVSERSLFMESNYLFKDFEFISNTPLSKFLSKPKISLLDRNHDLNLSVERRRITMQGKSDKGLSLSDQKSLHGELNRYLKLKQAGRPIKNEKDLLQKYRAMNVDATKTDIKLEIPNLGLKKGEFTAFDIIRKNEISGMVDGGIRVIIHG